MPRLPEAVGADLHLPALDLLRRHRFVTREQLAGHLRVSPQEAGRVLEDLHRQGTAHRTRFWTLSRRARLAAWQPFETHLLTLPCPHCGLELHVAPPPHQGR